MIGAAKLERTGPLKVFALEVDLGPERALTDREVTTGVRCAAPAMCRAARLTSSAVGSGKGVGTLRVAVDPRRQDGPTQSAGGSMLALEVSRCRGVEQSGSSLGS